MSEGFPLAGAFRSTGSANERLTQLCLLALAMIAMLFARNALGPLQETMSIALRLSDTDVAWLQGPAATIPFAVGAVPLGLLADRFSRKRLLLLYLAIVIVASFATAAATSFWVLLAARSTVGIFYIATWITVMSLIADFFEADHRGRAIMIVAFGETIGGASAFAAGGPLLAMFEPSMDAWRWAMTMMALALLPVMLALFFLREPERQGVLTRTSLSARAVWQILWQYRAIIAILTLGRVMLFTADGAATIWAAPMFARSFGLGTDSIGILMGIILLGTGLIGSIIAGLLSDHCQRIGGPCLSVGALGVV